ncbi:MAG: right-handed parallel beta-helix repeat-containing protein, partial [Pseudomonadota bacterium]
CFNDCEAYEECVGGDCRCDPDCEDRDCGDDGCGDQCPPGCGESETCSEDGLCVPVSDCFAWPGSPSLQDAVNAHACVEIQAGTFSIGSTVSMPANHELRGLAVDRSILVPSSGFDPEGDVAMIVINQSNVLLKKFAVDGSQGGQAKLDVVVLGAGTTGVVMEEMRIDGARCDGLSMGGDGTIIRDSTLSNNGYNCPPINKGSAIYAEGNVHIEGGQFSHAPQIIGNVIENNPDGSGIDMAEVSDGVIRGNTIRHCGANGGISIYHGHGWVIEDNDISDSGGWFNYGHPRCEGPTSPATIGIKLCRDGDIAGGTDNNTIRNNRSVGYYGILLAGDDEAAPYIVPRFNVLTGNDVMGSTVGCLDDFRPGQWEDGDNAWSGNNCRGTPGSGPDYF